MEIGAHIIVSTRKMLVFDVLVKTYNSPNKGGVANMSVIRPFFNICTVM